MRYLIAITLLVIGCAQAPDTAPIIPDSIDVSGIAPEAPIGKDKVYVHVPDGCMATIRPMTAEEKAEHKRSRAPTLPPIGVSSLIRTIGDLQKTAKNCTCFDCQCNKLKDNPACTCSKCECDEPQAKAYTGPYVEVHTSAYCGPCQTWKQVELPPLVNNGWVVGKHIRIVEYGQSGWPGSLPLYRFYRRGKLVHEQSGYMSRASIGDVFDRTQNVGREVIQSRAARQHEAVYRGARSPHAVCVNGVCR